MKNKKLSKLFLLATILIGVFMYSSELLRRDYTVDIFGYAILAAIFVYPLTFYIANLITRSFGAEATIKVVLTAVGVEVIYYWLAGQPSLFPSILATSVAFVIAQAANLYVVEDLIKRETNKYADWFMLYVLIFILDNILYIGMISNYNSVNVLTAPIILGVIFKCVIAAILGLGEILVLKVK